MISILISLLVLVAVIYVALWLVRQLPEPLQTVAVIIVVIIALLALLQIFGVVNIAHAQTIPPTQGDNSTFTSSDVPPVGGSNDTNGTTIVPVVTPVSSVTTAPTTPATSLGLGNGTIMPEPSGWTFVQKQPQVRYNLLQIIWREGSTRFGMAEKNGEFWGWAQEDEDRREIIGNIYQNPELLNNK